MLPPCSIPLSAPESRKPKGAARDVLGFVSLSSPRGQHLHHVHVVKFAGEPDLVCQWPLRWRVGLPAHLPCGRLGMLCGMRQASFFSCVICEIAVIRDISCVGHCHSNSTCKVNCVNTGQDDLRVSTQRRPRKRQHPNPCPFHPSRKRCRRWLKK